jgi:hypothetical protein
MHAISRISTLAAVLGLLATASCTGEGAPRPAPTSGARAPTSARAQRSPQDRDPVAPANAEALASPGMKANAPAQQAAAPSEPAEPPYDLAADRERRARVARQELGPRAVSVVVSDIFVVIGPPGWQGASFDSSVALMKSSMAGYMNNRFSKKPERAISVYLFAEGRSYEAFCQAKYGAPCIAHYGFYQPADRYMVMNAGLGLGTLTHEIVHPLVEADFPGAPTWINEGIASVFEAPVIPRPGEIHGVKNWRHPRLKRALSSPQERERSRLDVLFGMSDETFRGEAEDLHYAMARYVCQWLDERGKLWAFYQKWRDTAASDPTGEKAFTDVVGMTPREANVPWSKWVLSI